MTHRFSFLLLALFASGCATERGGFSNSEFAARSYFRLEVFDGRCSRGATRVKGSLAKSLARIDLSRPADLDCVAGASPDAMPLPGQPAPYYYYQTYLVIRSKEGRLDDDRLETLLGATGLIDAPPAGQTLYATATLFGSKGFYACDRDLGEQASKIGGLRYADDVNDAQRRIGKGEPQTCTHPIALDVLRRAAAVNSVLD